MIAYAIGVWVACGTLTAVAAVACAWLTRPAACGG